MRMCVCACVCSHILVTHSHCLMKISGGKVPNLAPVIMIT